MNLNVRHLQWKQMQSAKNRKRRAPTPTINPNLLANKQTPNTVNRVVLQQQVSQPEVGRLKAKLQNAQSNLERSKRDLHELKADSHSLRLKYNEAQERVKEVEGILQTTRQELRATREQCEKLQRKMDASRDEVRILSQTCLKYMIVNRRLLELAQTAREASRELRDLRTLHTQLKYDFQQSQSEIHELTADRQRLHELLPVYDRLREDNAGLAEENQQLNGELQVLRSEMETRSWRGRVRAVGVRFQQYIGRPAEHLAARISKLFTQALFRTQSKAENHQVEDAHELSAEKSGQAQFGVLMSMDNDLFFRNLDGEVFRVQDFHMNRPKAGQPVQALAHNGIAQVTRVLDVLRDVRRRSRTTTRSKLRRDSSRVERSLGNSAVTQRILIVGSQRKLAYLRYFRHRGVHPVWFDAYEQKGRRLKQQMEKSDIVVICTGHSPHRVWELVDRKDERFIVMPLMDNPKLAFEKVYARLGLDVGER